MYNPLPGGAVAQFYVTVGISTWTSNHFLGIGSGGPNGSATQIQPWVCPAKGKISGLTIQGLAAQTTGGALTVTVQRNAASSTPTYGSATTVAAVIPNNGSSGNSGALSYDVQQGDLLVLKLTGGTWPTSGLGATFLFVRTP